MPSNVFKETFFSLAQVPLHFYHGSIFYTYNKILNDKMWIIITKSKERRTPLYHSVNMEHPWTSIKAIIKVDRKYKVESSIE